MERIVAIKKLAKILGKSLGYRIDNKAPIAEERATARVELKPAIEKRKALEEKRDERRRAILAADAEYQALFAAHREACKEVDRLGAITRHYRFTVGTSNSMFFHIKAEGDSWEEVIAKLTNDTKQRAKVVDEIVDDASKLLGV